MVELETKVTESGILYVPKEIRECFSRRMKIIPSVSAAVFFPADARYEDVLSSLKIIEADLEQRIRMAKQKRKAEEDGETLGSNPGDRPAGSTLSQDPYQRIEKIIENVRRAAEKGPFMGE